MISSCLRGLYLGVVIANEPMTLPNFFSTFSLNIFKAFSEPLPPRVQNKTTSLFLKFVFDKNELIAGAVLPAQTGDPTGTGRGGSGQKLSAEFNTEPHSRGAVSMARAQSPDSADSQFFFVFDDASFLDRQYTVWGRVIDGMENVDKLTRGEPPAKPDKMLTVRVAADAA